jgi:taurine dioxygenase
MQILESAQAVPTGKALGVEIRGVDIRRPLSPAAAEAMRAAWHDHLVMIVREQPMTQDQHMAFTRNFGELEYARLYTQVSKDSSPNQDKPPFISVISNITVDGKPIGSLGSGEAMWHTDSSLVEEPPAVGFLHAIEIPPAGGSTYFLNMYAALETLPADLRRQIEGRQILHPATHRSDGTLFKGYENVTDLSQVPGAKHPIIRTHPETGRKALYLGRRPHASVVGLPKAESEYLLDSLWAHTTQDRFVYRHDWKVGDLVVWDNRCVMHRRDPFDPNSRRLMNRTQTKGTKPY